MGFGTEILFMIVLGVLLVGPKLLPTVLGHVARAKAEFVNASHSLKSQLESELEARHGDGKPESSQELDGNR